MFAADSHIPIWRLDTSHKSAENPFVVQVLQDASETDLNELQLMNMVKFLEMVVCSEIHR